MASLICLSALAAFGLCAIIGCILGWLLPKTGGWMVCTEDADAHAVARRFLWLRGMGLISCPLVVASCSLSPPEQTWMRRHGIEVCSPAELPRHLGIGEKEIGSTGNGDPPGHHQCRGVSEL